MSKHPVDIVELATELLNLKNKTSQVNWNALLEKLYLLNIGMEETLHFLYSINCTEAEIAIWLTQKASSLNTVETDINDVLSPADLLFFKTNGFVVVKNVVTQANCLDAQHAVYEFLNTNSEDEDGWYKDHPGKRGLMLTFSRHSALDKLRSSSRLKKAYEQLYKSKNIYKTIDKVSFNPPEKPSHRFKGEGQHLDVSLAEEVPFVLQGLIYLTDCGENDGSFMCVPGFHKKINAWIAEHKHTANIRALVSELPGAIKITGNIGDAVIWHQGLPHCASPNTGNNPRMVQYITYRPIGYSQAKNWL